MQAVKVDENDFVVNYLDIADKYKLYRFKYSFLVFKQFLIIIYLH